MKTTTHNLQQGSPAWHQFRAKHFGASEASAMLGISPYKSRDDLLREKATGITPDVDEATQRIFARGHELEALARPIAEGIIGDDLFQPTMSADVDGLPLSCSCDGLTLMQDVVWECKTSNSTLRTALPNTIPEMYHPQLEQMLLITGAENAMFMAYDGEAELHSWYESNPALRKRIIAGWKQFAADLETYEVPEVKVEPVAATVESLPALNVQISGGVTKSNLDDYKTYALNFIRSINTDLQTDQDFADADALVKFCGRTEKELEAVKKAALSQTADIADLFATIDDLKAEMRSKRLELDKLVKSRKQMIKERMVADANAEYREHIKKIEARLSHVARMADTRDITPDFIGAIKNKRTIDSLRNALNTELARCKIAANELADLIDTNIKAMLKYAPEHRFLFTDLQQTCTKAEDDFIAMVKLRVAEYKEQERRKLEAERERIRKEEEARAEAKAKAESERIRLEEHTKAREELLKDKAEQERAERERMEAERKEMAVKQAEATAKIPATPEPEKTASVTDIKPEAKQPAFATDFDSWWFYEGSGIIPNPGDDMEEHAKRVAEDAWDAALSQQQLAA